MSTNLNFSTPINRALTHCRLSSLSKMLAAANKGITASSLTKQSSLFPKFQIYLHQCNVRGHIPWLILILTSTKSSYPHRFMPTMCNKNRAQDISNKATIQGNTVSTAISHVVSELLEEPPLAWSPHMTTQTRSKSSKSSKTTNSKKML